MNLFRSRGFSLMEVLVAVVVISVGLLGMVALQADTEGTTTDASIESIVAMEAQSLAAAMTANTNYWAAGLFPLAPFTVGDATGTVTISSVTGDARATSLNSDNTDCTATACSSEQMASYDLKTWEANLSKQVPGASSTISCAVATVSATAAEQPSQCTIQITWTVKATAALNAGTARSVAASTSTYTLVEAL